MKNDKRKGYGIYYFYNGDRYEGEWKNDIFDGNGIFYIQNKKVYSKFKNFQPLKLILINKYK